MIATANCGSLPLNGERFPRIRSRIEPLNLIESSSIAAHRVPSPLRGERARVRGGRLSFFWVHGESLVPPRPAHLP